MQTAQTAQAEGNSRLVLQAIAQGTRLIKIILNRNSNWTIELSMRSWPPPSGPTRPASCPTTPRSWPSAAMPWPEPLTLPARKLRPPHRPLIPGRTWTVFRRNSCAWPKPAGQPKNENRLSQKWEKGGKLPGNSFGFDRIYEEYQRILEEEKITGKDKARAAQGR